MQAVGGGASAAGLGQRIAAGEQSAPHRIQGAPIISLIAWAIEPVATIPFTL